MFESLRAAKRASFTLSELSPPTGKPGQRAWSCSLQFFGVTVGSASATEGPNEFTLVIHKGLQEQILDTLKAHGFNLDLSKIPAGAIRPDTSTNSMRLAIAQIADEMDMVRELKQQAMANTLVVDSSQPEKVVVYATPFSRSIKAELLKKHPAGNIEILNETLQDL